MSTFSFQIHPSFRARRAPEQQPKIDRANSRLYGLVAGMDVEATGHEVCCDVKALEMIAELANAQPAGVSGRFGHPGMSENATGKKVHLAYNWRVLKGEKAGDPHTYLVHDAQLMEAARTSPAFAQDPIEYILKMAEQYPKHFGESLVLSAERVWTTKDGQELPIWEEVEDSASSSTDEEGYTYKRTRQRPENALTRVPVLRPTAVHFCDFVNDGALTHSGLYPMSVNGDMTAFSSLFTEESAPNYLLDHLFAAVDELRRRFHIPLVALTPKVERLLRLYIDARSVLETSPPAPRLRGEKGSGGVGDEQAGMPAAVAPPQPVFFQSAPGSARADRSPAGTPGAPMSLRKDEQVMSTRRQRYARSRAQNAGSRRAMDEQRTGRASEVAAAGEGAVELTEQDELSAETEDALDHATTILNQAEQMANSMVQSTVALSDAPMLASAAQVVHLQEQLDQHTDQLHELTHQLRKLGELLVKNMELAAVLQRSIARANGETVITQRVPVVGTTGWGPSGQEGFSFQQPAPGGWAVTQQPVSTEQRREALPNGVDPDSPEARAIRAQQRRAQQTRQ